MTKKEFQRHFDAVRCSDAFCQKMEILLSEESVPAAFADTADGVIQMNRRNTKAIAAIAACLLLVIGGGAGLAFFGRMQPANPVPVETSVTEESTEEPTAEEESTTETYIYPILTETIITEKTQETTASAEDALQTEAATSHRDDVTGTEATFTAGASAQTSTTIATEQHTTTTNSATTTTANTTTVWQGTTTYNETTTTHVDWAVCLDYDRSTMTVGETRAVEYYYPGYRGKPLEITIVSCSNNVTYEIDSANNMIYVTALEPGNVRIGVRSRGATFDSYVSLTIEGEGVIPDYATLLEYDKSPMKVGETRAIRYFHPLYPDTPTGTWLIDEVSDNISYQLDETKGYVYVTALAAGDAKIYIAADGCSFGQYAYLTIEEADAPVLEYDASPMKVGETRAVRFYHPKHPDSNAYNTYLSGIDTEIADVRVSDDNRYIYITALAAGQVNITVGMDECQKNSVIQLAIQ